MFLLHDLFLLLLLLLLLFQIPPLFDSALFQVNAENDDGQSDCRRDRKEEEGGVWVVTWKNVDDGAGDHGTDECAAFADGVEEGKEERVFA